MKDRITDLEDQLETTHIVKRVVRDHVDIVKRQYEERLKGTERTTLTEFLADCHRIFVKPFELAEHSILSNGLAADVKGRRYPMWLRPWSEFPKLVSEYYTTFDLAFGNKQLFNPTMFTERIALTVIRDPAAIEKHIDKHNSNAIEFPVREILKALLKAILMVTL
ncbi:hypothetical protein F4680DRAFT_442894 [Xylaria scruposa]|nr:hypothetical protein F4680DRAFT_442894 [Xylaria scruposa]